MSIIVPPEQDAQRPLSCPTCGEWDMAPTVIRDGPAQLATCQCPSGHRFAYEWVEHEIDARPGGGAR